jgi:hypothetical protein
VPADVRTAKVPASLRRRLPLRFQRDAERVLRAAGVTREQPLGAQLDGLVGYFRSFEPKSLALTRVPAQEELYAVLALGRRGVCRHRAYAFVITALAMGVPARLVANEAHVFVEVRIPSLGWRRIDLGGGADLLDVEGAHDKVVRRPRGPDPFPWPGPGSGSSRGMALRVRGLRPDQLSELADGRTQGTRPSGGGNRTGGDSTGGDSGGPGGGGTPRRMGDAPWDQGNSHEAVRSQRPVAVRFFARLEHIASTGFRGDPIGISGWVSSPDGPAAGRIFTVWLEPTWAEEPRALGTVLTDVAGRFSGRFRLPEDLKLGRYRIVLVPAAPNVR